MKRTFEGRKTIIIDSKLVDKVLSVVEDIINLHPNTDRTKVSMSTDLKFNNEIVSTENKDFLSRKDVIEGKNVLTISIEDCPGIDSAIYEYISNPMGASLSRSPYTEGWVEKDVYMRVADDKEIVDYNMSGFTINNIYVHTSDSVEVLFDASYMFASRIVK